MKSLLNTTLSIVFILLLMAGLVHVKSQYDPDDAYIMGYGTSDLPKSDAQLWTRNALRIFFGMPPEPELPRLYGSVMLGSLFAISGSLATIVLIPALLVLWVLNYTFFLGNNTDRWMILGFSVLLLWLTDKIFLPLNLGSLMIDFLAFTLSFMAVFLLWQGCKRETAPHWPAINLALLYLGSVAAIRGLPILAGLLWISCIGFWFRHTLTKAQLGLLCVSYLLPLISESLLHRYYGIPSNLAFSLSSLTTPPHYWTYEFNKIFAQQWLIDKTITQIDVYQQYLHFIFSLKGISTVFIFITERIRQDFLLLFQPLLIGFCLIFHAIAQILAKEPFKTPARLIPSFLAGITLFLLAIGYYWIPITLLPSLLLLWLVLLLIAGVYYRMILFTLLLSLYLASLIIFILLGSSGGDRTAATYHFSLYLAILTLMFQPALSSQMSSSTSENPAFATGFPTVVILHGLILLLLYTGVYLWPNSMATTFSNAHRQNPQVVIKIAEQPVLERSLYFNPQGQIFFTLQDNIPLKQVISFQALLTNPPPSGLMNPSHSDNDRFCDGSLPKPYTLVGVHSLTPDSDLQK